MLMYSLTSVVEGTCSDVLTAVKVQKGVDSSELQVSRRSSLKLAPLHKYLSSCASNGCGSVDLVF